MSTTPKETTAAPANVTKLVAVKRANKPAVAAQKPLAVTHENEAAYVPRHYVPIPFPAKLWLRTVAYSMALREGATTKASSPRPPGLAELDGCATHTFPHGGLQLVINVHDWKYGFCFIPEFPARVFAHKQTPVSVVKPLLTLLRKALKPPKDGANL